MNLESVGQLLRRLRKEKGLTQQQIGDRLNISAKTVSKWECGCGFPDVSVLKELSEILDVNINIILSGDLQQNKEETGNMRKTGFYVCSDCGNILLSTGNSEISCCGRKLTRLEAKPSDEKHSLKVETIEDEFYITFDHSMTKEHYISFVAYVGCDRALIVRLYPEQNAEVRFPKMYGGKLYFYCNQHGLFFS